MTSSQTKVPRVAIYARQSVEEEQGIQQQVAECRDHAERQGWPVHHVFDRDNDVSGSKDRGETTDWRRMLTAYDDGEFDTLIVTEVSRLTRRLVDVLDVTPPARAMRIIVIRQGIDTATTDFQLKLLVLVAEEEIRIKAARALPYARARRKAGHPTAGKTPYGYRWVPALQRDEHGTRYEIDDKEGPIVRRIFREYMAGAPLGQIARDLTDAGTLTRSGSRWHSSTVRRILLNPLYAALLPPAQPTGEHSMAAIDLDACSAGAWEPIVAREEVLVTRTKLLAVRPLHSGTARRWLLSGLAVCSVCRQPVKSARGETHPTERKEGGSAERRRYHTYRCSGRPSHFMRNGEVIDEVIEEVCIQRLSELDIVDLVGPRKAQIDLPALRTRRDALEAGRAAVFQLVGSDASRLAAAEQQLDEIEEQIRAVDAELAAAVQQHPLADLMGVEDVRAWWQTRTLGRKRAIIESLMTVAIKPIGYGKRPRGVELLETLEITSKG